MSVLPADRFKFTPPRDQPPGAPALRLTHDLAQSPLFELDALADLIEHYPRADYDLIEVGAAGVALPIRQGDIGAASGRDALAAIEAGRLRLRLRHINRIDRRYDELLREALAALAPSAARIARSTHEADIVIASPGLETDLLASASERAVWQIAGERSIVIGHADGPALSGPDRERAALSADPIVIENQALAGGEFHARIAAGDLLIWRALAPYRIVGSRVLSIAVEMEFGMPAAQRMTMVDAVNSLLRRRSGATPRMRAAKGSLFWGKASIRRALEPAAIGRRVDFTLVPGRNAENDQT